MQWTGESDCYMDLVEFAREKVRIGSSLDTFELLAGRDSAQGWVPVPVGHYIVRNPGDHTDYWPVEPGYFKAKYREADSEESFETRVLKLLEEIRQNTKPEYPAPWSGPK